MDKVKKPIKGFQDLDVYQNTYKAMLLVFKHILPKLPKEEEYDLKNQLRRSTKAIPRLIAEGHSKRHQKRGFQKYLDDAMAESNETIVSLYQVRDLYLRFVDINVCNELIDIYDKASRQLYNLSLAWTKFSQRKEKPNRVTVDETSSATLAQSWLIGLLVLFKHMIDHRLGNLIHAHSARAGRRTNNQ